MQRNQKDAYMEGLEAKNLEARNDVFRQREALREAHRKGEISDSDFQEREQELTETIRSFDKQNL